MAAGCGGTLQDSVGSKLPGSDPALRQSLGPAFPSEGEGVGGLHCQLSTGPERVRDVLGALEGP